MTFSSIITGLEYDFAFASEGNDTLIYDTVPVDQADLLLLSPGIDAIILRDGDDTVVDDAGSRIYFGNAGNDSLVGNQGSDTFAGGKGDDILEGNLDNDVLFGNIGDDTLRGGDGRDVLFGGKNEDVLVGLGGNDLLFGDLGDDLLFGGDGDDTLTGGSGTDVFVVNEPGLGVDVITDFSTSATDPSFGGVDDKIRLPLGITFESLSIEDIGNSQTAVTLTSTGQALAVLQNIAPSQISNVNFTTTVI